MIQVQELSKRFGGQHLFTDISFIVGKGERIGLVGRNGSGKSTLFKIFLGFEEYDAGEVHIPKNYKLGHLEQHIKFTQATVLEECVLALSEDEKFDHYKAEKILFGLGLTEEDLEKSPTSFSGGFQIRINLAKTLLQRPDLLLLDEPTNYLDIVSIRWLRNFLKNFPGELIMITHDRDFMDSIVTHIVGINRKKIKKVQGQTEKFYQQLSLDDEMYEKTRLNLDRKRQHLTSFVERFGAKASKAVQAQSKVKQLQKMGTMEMLEKEVRMGLQFKHRKCPGKTILEVENLSFDYHKNLTNPLIDNFKLSLGRGEKIAIIGKNGKGKSTLLSLLANKLEFLKGERKTHPAIQQGFFGQTNIARLDELKTIVEEIQSTNTELSISEVRGICGAMMFEGDAAKKKIEVLSGGERSRVLLGKILAYPTNILFLDEPTNHLDMETIEALTKQIKVYPGAVIIVTHSESLLRNIAERLIVFRDNTIELFDGHYDDFLRQRGWGDESFGVKVKKNKNQRKDIKRKKSELAARQSNELRPLKKELESLEKEIESLEIKKDSLNANLITAAENSHSQKISTLSIELRKIESDLERGYLQYDKVTSKIDLLKQRFSKELKKLE